MRLLLLLLALTLPAFASESAPAQAAEFARAYVAACNAGTIGEYQAANLDFAAVGRRAFGDAYTALPADGQAAVTGKLQDFVRLVNGSPSVKRLMQSATFTVGEPRTTEAGVEVDVAMQASNGHSDSSTLQYATGDGTLALVDIVRGGKAFSDQIAQGYQKSGGGDPARFVAGLIGITRMQMNKLERAVQQQDQKKQEPKPAE
jgi:hypothetical protein